jgi:hypothetical protein
MGRSVRPLRVIAEAAFLRPRREIYGSDMTAVHQGVDVALRDGLLQAVLRHDLGDQINLVLERREIVLGELAPFGADLLENDLLGLGPVAVFVFEVESDGDFVI